MYTSVNYNHGIHPKVCPLGIRGEVQFKKELELKNRKGP